MKAIGFGISIFLLILVVGCTTTEVLEQQVAEAEQKIVQKEVENLELQDLLTKMNQTLIEIQNTLTAERDRNDSLQSENLGLRSQVDSLQNDYTSLEAESQSRGEVITQLRNELQALGGLQPEIERLRLRLSDNDALIEAGLNREAVLQTELANERDIVAFLTSENARLATKVNIFEAKPLKVIEEHLFEGSTRDSSGGEHSMHEIDVPAFSTLKLTFRSDGTRHGATATVRLYDSKGNLYIEGSGPLSTFEVETENPDIFYFSLTSPGCTKLGAVGWAQYCSVGYSINLEILSRETS